MLRQACPELVDGLSTNGGALRCEEFPARPEPVEACPELVEGGERAWITIQVETVQFSLCTP